MLVFLSASLLPTDGPVTACFIHFDICGFVLSLDPQWKKPFPTVLLFSSGGRHLLKNGCKSVDAAPSFYRTMKVHILSVKMGKELTTLHDCLKKDGLPAFSTSVCDN